ncbi:MAG TPA: FecR family protein [Chryseolinea sp.]|nr:FecR family protein [Chryseolinea sp.]HPM31917.1 FecR family protein [Chryseolinea sp.]
MDELNPTHLIARYLSREATTEEQEQLLNWLAQNPSNKKVFENYFSLWEIKLPYKPEFDLAKGLQRLNSNIDQHEEEMIKPESSFHLRKIAASISVLLVTCIAIYFIGKYSEASSVKISLSERTTSEGEKTTITLSDGSIIQVNANSTFKFPQTFSRSKREVYLKGEAFFEVAKDSLRPFIVHTGNLATQVLGTSFNINTKGNQIAVSVATGKVSVSHENETQLLLPNEKITYSILRDQMIKSPANLEHDLAWISNTLIFEDMQLGEAAKMLEQNFKVKIIFENSVLKNCLITGKYKNTSLNKILDAISFSTGIQFKIIGKQVTLYGKGCDSHLL